MAITAGSDYYSCQICNVAEGGVLVQFTAGESVDLQENDEVVCWIEFLDKSFEANCWVARQSGSYMALRFCELGEDQLFFIRWLMDEAATS